MDGMEEYEREARGAVRDLGKPRVQSWQGNRARPLWSRRAALMLRNARHLEGLELRARDGRIGHVSDFLFDDRRWMVRYLVVTTGGWLNHRELLIAPASVHAADWNERVLPVDLTQDQVRHSPSIDTEEPISREHELALIRYYNWPMYWGASGLTDGLLYTTPPIIPAMEEQQRLGHASALQEQHHVRSVEDVRGYPIAANDGHIGHVDDFLIQEEAWKIDYLVIDTRTWWHGAKVLMAPEWIYEIGWEERRVFVDLSREEIQHSPPYDPTAPATSEYVDKLHAHYGRPPRRSAEP